MTTWYECEWTRDDGTVIDAWVEGDVRLAEPFRGWLGTAEEPPECDEVLDAQVHERLEDGTWREVRLTPAELERVREELYRTAIQRERAWDAQVANWQAQDAV